MPSAQPVPKWERTVYKSALTSRVNTTTLAADPHLSIAVPAVGDYLMTMSLSWFLNTVTTQGFKAQFRNAGGPTAARTTIRAMGASLGTDLATAFASHLFSGNSEVGAITGANQICTFNAQGILQAVAAGEVIALYWAQGVLDAANATELRDGYLSLRRM